MTTLKWIRHPADDDNEPQPWSGAPAAEGYYQIIHDLDGYIIRQVFPGKGDRIVGNTLARPVSTLDAAKTLAQVDHDAGKDAEAARNVSSL